MEFHFSGDISIKKHLCQRTQEASDQDNVNDIGVMKSSSEADAGSSSLLNSRLVAEITPSDQLANVVNRRRKFGASPGQTQYVTLKLTYDGIKKNRQALPFFFMKNNHITEPGMLTMLGKDGSKTMVRLYQDSRERMSLGKGWRDFVFANGIKIGDAFKLEAVWDDTTPMLKLLTIESKNKKKMEEGGTSSSVINHRYVTLKLTYEVLRDSTLVLPGAFMRANGIKKIGKIGFVGRGDSNWWGYLSSTLGNVVVGVGWEIFCKFNGVKEGDSFTLEFLSEDQSQFPVLKFSPNFHN